ncbi:hypothetical protein DMP10_07320 [Adlercreutzia equolifaciens subsp. celatus DSM 18785]|uniref:Uncharacterized protein n=1 Tax=Adlercreutzia equolifaciens subsp. celatus DSM 18785 TaxID=1121021 RepID=A0A3N0ASV8_9ACTN|nr:hypothetical protein DX904_06670 [Adlercreutzia equolifaciens subsp. celatus]RNL37619.1 hypothetical protein DMP10_07320 [Adlercreutzia equolifaciens subsp. celatus DSM 18785]
MLAEALGGSSAQQESATTLLSFRVRQGLISAVALVGIVLDKHIYRKCAVGTRQELLDLFESRTQTADPVD